MKKVWLMGKVRDLDLNDLKPFEDGVNDDLANFNGRDFKGIFEVRSTSLEDVTFLWKIATKKEYQPNDPGEIPMGYWWMITGRCRDFLPAWDFETNVIMNLCPNARITFIAKDLCDLYKDNSKYYGADKFKRIRIHYIANFGLWMTIEF